MVPLPVLETFDGTCTLARYHFSRGPRFSDSVTLRNCPAGGGGGGGEARTTQLPDGRAISDCSDLNLVGVQVAQCARLHVLPPRAYAVFLAS